MTHRFVSVVAAAVFFAGTAGAAPPIALTLQFHRFTPTVITAPAGQRVVIEVRNLDASPEEFESYDLKVEKLIVGHGKILVNLSPMKTGVYKFFGDYNPTSATGTLRVLPVGRR